MNFIEVNIPNKILPVVFDEYIIGQMKVLGFESCSVMVIGHRSYPIQN